MLRVKEICKQKGITQVELAKRLGISPSGLNQRIAGNPTLDKIEETANALGVHISELYTDWAGDELTALVYYQGKHYRATTLDELKGIVEEINSAHRKGRGK